jgi:hypothetical protein
MKIVKKIINKKDVYMSDIIKVDAKQVLLDELKKQGLDIAEDAAMSTVKAVIKALPQFFLSTENKYDDILIGILPIIEPSLLKIIDDLDGEADIAV